MTDIVDAATRSRMMSGIRSVNTKPELLIRRLLHRQGFRFRLHVRDLPGKPDIVLPRYRAVVFVHGCFWHGHSCTLFKMPKSASEFWKAKIEGNRDRDSWALAALRSRGWRSLVIWECAIRNKNTEQLTALIESAGGWIRGGPGDHELKGME